MGGEVLERIEPSAELVDVHSVERLSGLAQDEIAGGPGARTGEVACQEPLRRPRAEAANRRQAGPDLVIVEGMQRVQIELVAGEAEHVLRLPVREAKCEQLVLGPGRDALTSRERV